MSMDVLFWVLYIVALVFFGWSNYSTPQPNQWNRWGGNILYFVLIGILGWAQFGRPVK